MHHLSGLFRIPVADTQQEVSQSSNKKNWVLMTVIHKLNDNCTLFHYVFQAKVSDRRQQWILHIFTVDGLVGVTPGLLPIRYRFEAMLSFPRFVRFGWNLSLYFSNKVFNFRTFSIRCHRYQWGFVGEHYKLVSSVDTHNLFKFYL